jgi:hypothetical protein
MIDMIFAEQFVMPIKVPKIDFQLSINFLKPIDSAFWNF